MSKEEISDEDFGKWLDELYRRTEMRRSFEKAAGELSKARQERGEALGTLLEIREWRTKLVELMARLEEVEESLRQHEAQEVGHPVSDGMLTSIKVFTCGKPIPTEGALLANLSVRARKALRRSGLLYLSEISEKTLRGLPNCGLKTIRELLDWSLVAIGKDGDGQEG